MVNLGKLLDNNLPEILLGQNHQLSFLGGHQEVPPGDQLDYLLVSQVGP